MDLTVKDYDGKALSCEMLAVLITDKPGISKLPKDVRSVVSGYVREYHEKKIKKDILIPAPDNLANIRYLNIVFADLEKYYDKSDALRIAARRILDAAESYGITKIAILVNAGLLPKILGEITEGLLLGKYAFDKYKKKTAVFDPAVEIWSDKRFINKARSVLKEKSTLCASVNRCRTLVNEPGDVVIPDTFAKIARKIANKNNLFCEVLAEKDLARRGYPALLAVGRGSSNPPRLITLKYQKRKNKKHIVFIGKGITFDTGGVSIKPSKNMWEMKGDMSGAAAVLYAIEAIALLSADINVTVIIAAAENAIGQNAQKPGNIFIAKNGKSIHVDNTDAEGRLVLTDAFARSEQEKADYIIDIATLTGSCVRALGTEIAGVMGNHPALIRGLIEAGASQGEGMWELPLVSAYRKSLESPYADINNIGGINAGAITAGLFLREFIPESSRWAHIDIAGPFIRTKKEKYFNPGATGFGVKTLVELAVNWKKYLKR